MRYTKKGITYRKYFTRVKEAIDNDFHLEATWIIYSLLEDRLKSLTIEKLGLVLIRDNVESTIIALKDEIKINPTLSGELSLELLNEIDKWRKDRNDVIHFLTQERINEDELSSISLRGEAILRDIASVNMRIKKRLKGKAA
ncbi:hypothetical protein [Photobacterium leiognathi]|uniref:hypothetical protein n=1 Tax=Photobacterium leiognathi TaxID=553611 RepID=UPI0029819632|nr:hypothetical protein [Photobacterium leiognathi]